MKVFLLALLCSIFSLSASAQFFSFLKAKRNTEQLAVQYAGVKLTKPRFAKQNVTRQNIEQSDYWLMLNEYTVMKQAQHQMRFRQYEDASYSFADLARIYIRLNRLSEAKWFFLQSNNLSRQQSNDRLTIANLRELAGIKATIGDFALAQQDLDEARGMATGHNWTDDILLVKKSEDDINRNKLAMLKPGETTLAKAAQTTL